MFKVENSVNSIAMKNPNPPKIHPIVWGVLFVAAFALGSLFFISHKKVEEKSEASLSVAETNVVDSIVITNTFGGMKQSSEPQKVTMNMRVRPKLGQAPAK